MRDLAWELGDGKTNKKIIDGCKVELLYPTIADGKEINAGCMGTVKRALTPKVFNKKGTSPYFANVDMDNGVRIRVPHGALKIL